MTYLEFTGGVEASRSFSVVTSHLTKEALLLVFSRSRTTHQDACTVHSPGILLRKSSSSSQYSTSAPLQIRRRNGHSGQRDTILERSLEGRSGLGGVKRARGWLYTCSIRSGEISIVDCRLEAMGTGGGEVAPPATFRCICSRPPHSHTTQA